MTDKFFRCLFIISLLFIMFATGFAARHFEFEGTQAFTEAYEAVGGWVAHYREKSKKPELVTEIEQLNDKKRVRWNNAQAFNGYTLVTYRYSTNAYLLDMLGNIVHKWKMPFHAVWPRAQHVSDPVDEEWIYMEKAYAYPNGDLLAIYTGIGDTPYGYGMVKLDKNSNILWTYDENTHHDFHVDSHTGNITVLVQSMKSNSSKHYASNSPTVLADELVVLSSKGREIKRVSIGDAFENSPYDLLLNDYQKNSAQWDRFHTNSVDVLQPEMVEKFPMFSAGQVLISIRNMDTVAVLDINKKTIVWAYNGLWRAQHSARFLDNGNIMVFDNKGHAMGKYIYSRIVEINPATLGVSWKYAGGKDNLFFTDSYGRAQRLPNGNTLIVESLRSHIFEITPEHKMVWEYRIPQAEIMKTKHTPRSAKRTDLMPYYVEEPLLFEPLVTGIIVSAIRYNKTELPFLNKE